MVDIWSNIDGKSAIKPMMAKIYRLVESQEQVATLHLVHNLYEQEILEDLIEKTKSCFVEDSNTLHYLLKTPFRYPPLKHGSRFGASFQQGIFYGSLHIRTALIEAAYYRFVYMLGPKIPYKGVIVSEHTEFSVHVKSDFGIYLDELPFSQYESILISPTSYSETQQLGSHMRQNNVEIFRYISARDKNRGKNIGLFSPKSFVSRKPIKLHGWICQTKTEEVGFFSKEEDIRLIFNQKDFWVNGDFPSPAA